MEQVTYGDFDYLLLQLKRKMEQETPHPAVEEQAGPNNRVLVMDFWVQIPKELKMADAGVAPDIFWSERRPSQLFVNEKKNVGITLQLSETKALGYDVAQSRAEIKKVLENIDGRIVFYEEGSRSNVLWFDYKSFAKNIIVYNIMFLFELSHGNGIVMGTFFCPFADYDKWKSIILEMLGTIEQGEMDEGL